MLSLAITAFDEMTERRSCGEKLLQAIHSAQINEHVAEIIVVDDGSDDFSDLYHLLKAEPKVHLYHNPKNLGVFGNKIEAVVLCNCEWVITCDSDNRMNEVYLSQVASLAKRSNTWYCPSFARPRFDYRHLIGNYALVNLGEITKDRYFPCFFNTGNQVVHRKKFTRVFDQYRGGRADLRMPNYLGTDEEERKSHYWRMVFDACDSFLLNMEWVLAGNRLCITRGLEYDHYYTTGDEGNYARSPQEKDELGMALLKRLLESVEKESC